MPSTIEDLAALGPFFGEEERLRQEQVASVRSILAEPLSPEDRSADLVYVLDTLVEAGFAPDDEILPTFQELWVLQWRRDASALEKMRRIQAGLCEQFAVRLGV